MSKVFVLHENTEWYRPLAAALDRHGVPHDEMFLDEGVVEIGKAPPQGIFYNRTSASSFLRGHDCAPDLATATIAWLEASGRRVINGGRAVHLELNKSLQYAALHGWGITIPRTIVAVGRDAVLEAADEFAGGPVILKPNRGGTGAGVRRFETVEELKGHVEGSTFEMPPDSTLLVQEYIVSRDDAITRAEFIGSGFFYAVRVDTDGSFNLCPADRRLVVGAGFSLVPTMEDDLRAKYESFLAAHDIEIGSVEFITDSAGRAFTYDINVNTNYNPKVEVAAEQAAYDAVAKYLAQELE